MMKQETEARPAGEASSPATAIEGIAVCGSNPHTIGMAPFNRNWLIYACSPDNSPHGFSENAQALPRVDEWFEVHVPVFDKTRPYAYLDWLRNIPKVWMRDEVALNLRDLEGNPIFPTAELYPEKEIKERFGPFTFTSSIAFQMAKAIVDCEKQGIGQIGLFGIMQRAKNEYRYQRPGIQNLIAGARKAGIHVLAPDISALFEPPEEGF